MRNGGLVRTVGGAGGQTTLADSLFAGFEAAEGLVIRRCNAQLGQRGEVQLRHGAGQALGPGQRILDGNAHVGHTELRNDRMICKLHGGVDDALTLDDDLNLILGQTEQPRGLDQLQTLVHQGRRINRDFGAHIPVRVLERVGLRLGAQLLGGHAEKRAAGGRQQDLLQRFGAVLILQALENSAVLAVHGQQVDAVLFDSIGHKMAARDKAFFVGQRQIVAALNRSQRGVEARNADNGVQHRARAVHTGQRAQSLRALEQLRRVSLPGQRGGELVKRGGVGDGDVLRVELRDLRQQLIDAGIGGQAEHLIAVHTADVQALGADGTRGAQKCDDFTHFYDSSQQIKEVAYRDGNKGRDEHDAVKAVQNASVPREDRAVILDADLALDGRREQVTQNAQH